MSKKYEREIRDILDKMDRESPEGDWRKRDRDRWKQRRTKPNTPRFTFNLNYLIWVGVGAVVIAFFLHSALPFLAMLLALGGVLAFISPIVISIFTGGRSSKEVYWRGQPVRPKSRYSSTGVQRWWQDLQKSLSRWFKKG